MRSVSYYATQIHDPPTLSAIFSLSSQILFYDIIFYRLIPSNPSSNSSSTSLITPPFAIQACLPPYIQNCMPIPISKQICTTAHALNCHVTFASPKKKYDVLNASPRSQATRTEGRKPATLLVRWWERNCGIGRVASIPRAMKPRIVVYVGEVPRRSWKTVKLSTRAVKNYKRG